MNTHLERVQATGLNTTFSHRQKEDVGGEKEAVMGGEQEKQS